MSVQTMEVTTADTFKNILRGMSALSEQSIKKLADYVEELIEDQEEAEDIAYIEAHKDDPVVPFSMKDF